MGDVGMISTPHTRQESLLAAHHLLRELEANESLTDDMRRILAEMDSKLSAMNVSTEGGTNPSVKTPRGGIELDEFKVKLRSAEEKIMVWESNKSMIWESGQGVALEYIEVVGEVRSLVECLRELCGEGNEVKEILSQGENVHQVALARLEEELVYILVHKRQTYEASEVEDDGSEGGPTGAANEPGKIEFDLVEADAIVFLQSIKDTMFAANYAQEFCAAYIRTQKEALEDCLIGLGMETLSIDELCKMDWGVLDSKIKTWVQVIRTAVHVYFAAENRLCCRILGECEAATSVFVNIAKSSLVCLLNFGHAMALGTLKPEKLFNLLDMYEVLSDLQEESNALFLGEDGSMVRTEFQEVMNELGHSARATFLGFGDVILSDPSSEPFPGGGVHPLSSYVMNYLIVYLPDYSKTLNSILEKKDNTTSVTTTNRATTEDHECFLASHLRSITTKLKSNLEKKSQLYKDVALQHVFLMNNIHYIQQKVMGSELRALFGDEWIRTQIVTYQQHATSYVRTTWSSVVACLKDEGISGSGSGVKAILKDRIRIFSIAFEDVYRSQTGWIIRDEQLKEELRISISQKVILAYQSFIGRHNKYDIEKYVKYDSDDLEDLLRDFFEGSQKSLHYSRRR